MGSSFQVTRRAHFNRFIEFLDRIGAPVEQGVRYAKLPVEAIAPDTIVTVQAVWDFVDFMSRRTGIDALGLEVGAEAQERALSGALRAGIESAPTLLDGIHLFCRRARA